MPPCALFACFSSGSGSGSSAIGEAVFRAARAGEGVLAKPPRVPEPRADQPLSCAAPRRAAASGLCAAACATRGGDTLFLGLGFGFGSLVLA